MKRERERGGVAIIVLGAMVAVLGFGAVVIDGGMLYHTQARLQSAADMAALAGARVLLSQGAPAAIALATSVAMDNGLNGNEVLVTVDLAAQSVSVNARRTVSLGLARILNRPHAEVGASAVAAAQSVSAMRGVMPLGVVWRDFIFQQVYVLKIGGGGGDTGWYGALDLGRQGGGASLYEEHLKYGWDGMLRVGDRVPTESGNKGGPNKRALNYRITRCNHVPACTFALYVPRCPRLLVIPVVTPQDNGQVEILGFAGFFVENFSDNKDGDYIRGRFVEFVAEGEAAPIKSYGARKFSLIR